MKINKIIIWGHPLHSHTHSYIHNGFFIAFKELGYDTYWFHDNMNIDSSFDFSNSLFITEHQVDNKIPKKNDCLYFVHFLKKHKYPGVNDSNLIDLKCSFRDMKREKENKENDPNLLFTPITDKKIEFYSNINNQLTYFILWATDLLPRQIMDNINNISTIINNRTNNIFFIGQLTNNWNQLKQLCQCNNIPFVKYGATFNNKDPRALSIEDNQKFIQQSFISPALQDELQIKEDYVPCRIFKNISYGRMGITNNPFVYNLFDKKILFDSNINNLFEKSINFEKNYDSNSNDTVISNMKYVMDNHTYIQRIESLKLFINTNTIFNI